VNPREVFRALLLGAAYLLLLFQRAPRLLAENSEAAAIEQISSRVEAGGLVQYDEVRSGGSYRSANNLRLHVGLGAVARIDRLELAWASGQKDIVENPPLHCILMVKEGEGPIASKPFQKLRPAQATRVNGKG